VYRSVVITIAGSIVLCSVNDRKKRGERGKGCIRLLG
jgi:hypothetical protein